MSLCEENVGSVVLRTTYTKEELMEPMLRENNVEKYRLSKYAGSGQGFSEAKAVCEHFELVIFFKSKIRKLQITLPLVSSTENTS